MLLYHPPEVELDLVGIHHYQSGLKNITLVRPLDAGASPSAVVAMVAVGAGVKQVVVVVVPLVLAMRQCYCYQRR